MVNYEKDVYYTKIEYDRKMNETKKLFIEGKFNGVDNEEFKRAINGIWLDIDHSYMEQTIARLQNEIRSENGVTLQQQRSLPNKYKLNSVETFEKIESKYGNHISRIYANSMGGSMEYLTKRIQTFDKVERTIPYYHNGEIYSMHTPSEYLSMLYNVNLRMASWNQTIKDGQVLGIDTVKLISHPNACPICNTHAEQLYSISGKGKYPSIDLAYADGVGHPNCKCNFILWWGDSTTQDVRTDYYEEVQKAEALSRNIEKQRVNYDLYRYIGNQEEADITLDLIDMLAMELEKLLIEYDIEKYLF